MMLMLLAMLLRLLSLVRRLLAMQLTEIRQAFQVVVHELDLLIVHLTGPFFHPQRTLGLRRRICYTTVATTNIRLIVYPIILVPFPIAAAAARVAVTVDSRSSSITNISITVHLLIKMPLPPPPCLSWYPPPSRRR